MKKFFWVVCLLMPPCLAFAVNKITMVTYFPVPYVAYSKINAQKQLDVGLTSACEMSLGCDESGALGHRPLQASVVNLREGKLDLNAASAVKSTNVTLGSGSGSATLDFKTNVRIGTLQNGYSLESNDMTVDELKLFASHMRSGGEKFPSCASTGASGAPQVSWQKVKLKKAEEVYLVCGTATAASCDPPSGEATSQNCPSGYSGTQTRTWNYNTCSWNSWEGTCTKNGQWVRTGSDEEVCMCNAQCRNTSVGPSPVGNAAAGGECTQVGAVVYVPTSNKRCYCVRDGLNMGPCTISVPEVMYWQYTCR